MNAPQWLEREVARGLQALLAARLPFAPADDSVNLTLDVWLVALEDRRAWDEMSDAPCVRSAFKTLLQRCDAWPSPKQFLDHLPARAPPKALPRRISDEERIVAQEHLKIIYQTLLNRKKFK